MNSIRRSGAVSLALSLFAATSSTLEKHHGDSLFWFFPLYEFSLLYLLASIYAGRPGGSSG